MYKRAANYLRGYVLLQVESACPERILNLCAVREIPFWDLKWQSEIAFSFRMTRRDLQRLKLAAEETEVQLQVREERGAPVFLGRFRRRYALLLGFALFWLFLFGGNFFIWGFEVAGNDTLPDEVILRALEEYGIGVGTRGFSIDQEDMRNHVLLKLKEVSWLAVNVRGCVAHVQVVERQRPPRIIRDTEICNVVADRAGLVTRVQALDGKAEVAVGSTVTEGQLLISGVVDSERHGLRLLHGIGTVWARTWRELSVSLPMTVEQKTEKAAEHTRFAVDFGKHRIKFYGKGSVTEGNCDKIIRYSPMTLVGGFRLPVTLVTEHITRYDTETVQRSTAQAQEEGEQLLLEQLLQQLGEGGSIENTRFDAVRQGDCLLLTLRAECLEQIGRQELIEDLAE